MKLHCVLPSVLIGLAQLGLTGCAMRRGAKTIPVARFDYSNAINRSYKEQTLLTLVKMRYLDPPMLLDVQQVVTQYTFEGSASIGAGQTWNGIPNGGSATGAITGTWTESPTITYLPMTGEKFTKSLLRPIEPGVLFTLIQTGWPIDAVLGVAVKMINGLQAGSLAAFDRHAANPDFYRVLGMLRELQDTGQFGLRVEQKEGAEVVIAIVRRGQLDAALAAKAREVRQLLHLNPDAEEFTADIAAVAASDKEIAMETRSMLEIITEASAGVDIPDPDTQEGRATTMGPAGKFAFRVRSSDAKPAANDAFTAVQYRNHWFWIDDRDLRSKRGLGFLMILLSLAESGKSAALPVLTISRP